jgi:hypothetical protein
VVERGDLFFFYRPRVERNAPRGEDDVQRFLVVLAPDAAGARRFRLLTVGRKRLPGASARLPPDLRRPAKPGRGGGSRERNWGWVMKVVGAPEELVPDLRGYRYETKTRGVRDQPAARPAGAGRYALARHGSHTHLAYALARPAEPGPVQRELGIEASASLVVAVKNPHWPTPASAGAGLAPEAEAFYSGPLQAAFRGRRWAPVEPGHLDREGAELVLVATPDEPDEALGIRLEAGEPDDVLGLFDLDPARHPVAPLFRGDWA